MGNENIIVRYLRNEHKLTIHDNSNNLLGSFSVLEIIKYITSSISNSFLKAVDYESSKTVIEKFFCNKIGDEIQLKSYLDSPIMGNLEIMMQLYTDINKFDVAFFQQEMEKIEIPAEKIKVIKAIKNLEYLILNHSLKLIVNISNAVKKDDTKKELKDSLLKYSIFITNKINHIIYDEIHETKKNYNLLESQLEQVKKIKEASDNKLKNFEAVVNHQNEQIKKILNYIDVDDIDNLENVGDGDNISEEINMHENPIVTTNNSFGNNNDEAKGDSNFNDGDYSFNDHEILRPEVNIRPTNNTQSINNVQSINNIQSINNTQPINPMPLVNQIRYLTPE